MLGGDVCLDHLVIWHRLLCEIIMRCCPIRIVTGQMARNKGGVLRIFGSRGPINARAACFEHARNASNDRSSVIARDLIGRAQTRCAVASGCSVHPFGDYRSKRIALGLIGKIGKIRVTCRLAGRRTLRRHIPDVVVMQGLSIC